MRRSMIIRRDLRKKGLASKLIEALLGALTLQGIDQATLIFPPDQARMINLSKDLGFCVVPDSTAQVCASKRLQAAPAN